MPTLLTPLRYLSIQHRSKALYDIVLPIVIGGGMTWLLIGIGGGADVFGEEGYISEIQDLLTILAGFFIAALTLVTTNRDPLLSAPVAGTGPRMGGEATPLSRRRLLGYLFGYLAFSSIALVVTGVIANLLAPDVAGMIAPAARRAVEAAFLLIFNTWLGHVVVATLLGLYYFTERLQIADPVVSVGRPTAPPTPAE